MESKQQHATPNPRRAAAGAAQGTQRRPLWPEWQHVRRASLWPAILTALCLVAACEGDGSASTPSPEGAVETGADSGASSGGATSSSEDPASPAGNNPSDVDGSVAAGSGSSSPPTGSGGGPGTTPDAGTATGAPGSASECTRELLADSIATYFTALAAHDPSMLPTSEGVKFTEDGVVLELGEGLWETAGPLVYEHSALDTELCMSVSEAVVVDDGVNIPFGLRLRLEAGLITEIETIAVHEEDYTSPGVTTNPDAIIASADVIGWAQPVPEGERSTRAEIDGWVTNYFESFPQGICDVASDCRRLENGGGNFNCSTGGGCGGTPGGFIGPFDARLVVVDVERGIGVGFTMFNFLGATNTDFHMIKMFGGQVRAVHTIVAKADESGWE